MGFGAADPVLVDGDGYGRWDGSQIGRLGDAGMTGGLERGVNAVVGGVGVDVAADEGDGDVVGDVPDLGRLEVVLEVGHGAAGDAVHDLVVEHSSRPGVALEDGEIERLGVEIRGGGAVAVADLAVTVD